MLRAAISLFLASVICARPAAAQTTKPPVIPGSLWDDLREFVETPAVPGYETQLAEKIRAKLAAFHPVTDNLGDVIVTIGSGSPHRLLVAPLDEPGFVVSGITDDGYLRLQRLPESSPALPPIFNQLWSAQPVKVGTSSGKWLDGVVPGLSVHLQDVRANPPKAGDIENMYVDIGASSADEVRHAGVDILSPVAINRSLTSLGDEKMAGAAVGDRFGAAVLVRILRRIDPVNVRGTLTVAFVAQQWTGARGLQRILTTSQADEMIYVGRLFPGGTVPGAQGLHRAPRREPGSGVLLGLDQTSGELSGFAGELKQLADTNKIPFATDYSAALIPSSYLPMPVLPAKWAHLAIAVASHDTPGETIEEGDVRALTETLLYYLSFSPAPSQTRLENWDPLITGADSKRLPVRATQSQKRDVLRELAESYGTSGHERMVRDSIRSLLPDWTKPDTDGAENLVLRVGAAPPNSKAPKILVIAHMDEIGFEVKSISSDGRLEVETLGGMDLSYYQGHPALVHSTNADHDAIIELPSGWDEPNFQWPAESERAIRVDVGGRSPDEVAKLGIKVGDSITIPKQYRPLLRTRANGRSFDDRVGCAALISAVWALGGPLKDRDVTFVWSTGEEIGLVGAAALAKRLAAEGREPDYVFAVDTFVSSDSPLESKRFADAELGKGFVIRAVDNSNIARRDLVERVVQLARANHIPVQYGVTGGGNDGSAFVRYGAADIAIGWPLRYSHSPAEVIDTSDVDSLARIITEIAKSW